MSASVNLTGSVQGRKTLDIQTLLILTGGVQGKFPKKPTGDFGGIVTRLPPDCVEPDRLCSGQVNPLTD